MKSSTTRVARLGALALALIACNSDRLVAPGAIVSGSRAAMANGPAGPVIRISEFHYDNANTDANERIEISGPAGVNLAGWQVVRYNGANATAAVPYTSPAGPTITGVIPDQCTGRGTLVFGYPVDGLQNGPNDGFALVNNSGVVVEFLTYEGGVTASTGVAAGMNSTVIPVSEPGTTGNLSTGSIQRTPTGGWTVSATTNTFGACNDNDGNTTVDPDFGPLAGVVITTASPTNIVVGSSATFAARGVDAQNRTVTTAVITWSTPNPALITVNSATGVVTANAVGETTVIATSGAFSASAIVKVLAPTPTVNLPPTRVSEIHYDNSGTDVNEGFEIEGPVGVSLSGWSVALYTGGADTVYNTIPLSGTFAATCNGRGAISVMLPTNGIQNGGGTTPEPDGLALINGTTVVQFLSYEGTFTAANGPAAGMTSVDIGNEESSSTLSTQSLQLNTAGAWERKTASFGQVNACADAVGVATISLSHNGPDTLVVGWQRRAFVVFRDANGTTVTPTPTITWSSDTPTIASVDSRGYATATSAGTAVIRATIGTTTNTYSFASINYEPVTAQYRNHLEFGTPLGADPANNIVISKPGFVTSYNAARGGPNWVSWNINATTFGDAERCECFSSDPQLSIPDAQKIVDFDYVSGGYDRGHMVQSESRTSTHSENAATFLLTNILPQAANNNQGPWLGFENFLNDRARIDGKQVYVVAGGEYAATPTTLKNAGRVAIPDYTWKVAIVMNIGTGLADIRNAGDITVYAVRIPNLLATAPAKNNIYAPFLTTIDDIEARTGYDFFTALPDNIERVVESNDRPPVAVLGGSLTGVEGAALSFDATGSTDPDAGDILTYRWEFTNGVTSTAAKPTVIFTDDGAFTATLTVTDRFGATSTVSKTINISNVAPTVSAFAGASIIAGGTFTSGGSISDPGADTFSGTVDYGDGSGTNAVSVTGSGYSLDHTYEVGGTYTVTVVISDDDGASVSRTATVSVDHKPVPAFSGPTSGVEGASLSFDATESTDADAGDVLTFSWTFSNGFTSTSATPTVLFADDGDYTATLTVTDNHGAASRLTKTIHIINIAPTVSVFDGASIIRGQTYTAGGVFTDPGADVFTALVNYGDGTGTTNLALNGTSYSLSHTYAVGGTFTVTLTIADEDGGSTVRTATVFVDNPPIAMFTRTSGVEGTAITFDGNLSTDADADDVLTYQWTFANGVTSTSATPTVLFTDNGAFLATLTVTDSHGASSQITKTVTIANVAPTVAAFSGASILRTETFTSNGTFSDPGLDTHTATVNYGDGSGAQPLALSGNGFSLSHLYATAGTFTVTVTVKDDDGDSHTRTATVTVASAAEGIAALIARVSALEAAGTLSKGESNALDASLRNALKSVENGRATPANGQLSAFVNKVEAMQQSGRLDAATATSLIAYANRIIASL